MSKNEYRIMMVVESDGDFLNDARIEKIVVASTEKEALDAASELLKVDNPTVDASRVWAWTIERLRR